MKKYILTLILTILSFVGFGQYTLFSENIGTTATPATIAISVNTFQNVGLTFSGNADIRLTNPSIVVGPPLVSQYVGASGSRNVFFTNYSTGTPSNRFFIISNINTTDLFGLSLSFGHFKSDPNSNNELIVEVSSDGTTYNPLNYSRTTGAGTGNTWVLITTTGTIPSTPNLRIRFRNSSPIPPFTPTTFQFRIDDIKLTYETALPIELLSFEGSKKEDYNVLKWRTASEHNNSHFILERSSTGDYTEKDVIGVINGAGNSTQLLDYDFVDTDAPESINYYRLTQVDYDGNFKQYGPISIDNRVTRNIVKYFNIMGQEVNEYERGLIILQYEDGTVEKVIK